MLKKFLVGTFIVAAFALVASSASADCSITTTLKVGSKGAEVSCLQTKVGATSDGSFGPMTKASVMAYQSNHGLSADGVVGPMSRAVLNGSVSGNFSAGCTSASGFSATTGLACVSLSANTFAPPGCTNASGFSPVTGGACYATSSTVAGCSAGALFSSTTGASCSGTTTTTTTTTVVTGPLAGGAGTIVATETATDVNNYMVEGQSDVKVLGFKVQAFDSDAKVSNLKVTLTHSVSGSTYLDRYVSNVSVWMNGTKIATVAASDFNKDLTGVYSKSISLSDAIVRMGIANKATFYITLSGVSNIDTADMSAKWNVAVSDFRYQDGTGIVMSYSPVTTDNLLIVNDINSTGDVKLVISKDTTSPIVGNVKVSSTSSTSDLLMLALKAKNTGADMTFDSMSFSINPTTNPVAMIGELALKDGSNTLATWTPTATTTGAQVITFNLDSTYTLPADTTKTFTVVAKINDIDNFTSGALTVSYDLSSVFEVASTRTNLNETGAAVGEAQTFINNGASVTYVSSAYTAATAGSSASQGSISITFNVTALGDNDVVIKNDGTGTGTNVTAVLTGGTNASATSVSSSSLTAVNNLFTVTAGDTKTFTVTRKFDYAAGFVSLEVTNVAGTAVSNVKTATY